MKNSIALLEPLSPRRIAHNVIFHFGQARPENVFSTTGQQSRLRLSHKDMLLAIGESFPLFCDPELILPIPHFLDRIRSITLSDGMVENRQRDLTSEGLVISEDIQFGKSLPRYFSVNHGEAEISVPVEIFFASLAANWEYDKALLARHPAFPEGWRREFAVFADETLAAIKKMETQAKAA